MCICEAPGRKPQRNTSCSDHAHFCRLSLFVKEKHLGHSRSWWRLQILTVLSDCSFVSSITSVQPHQSRAGILRRSMPAQCRREGQETAGTPQILRLGQALLSPPEHAVPTRHTAKIQQTFQAAHFKESHAASSSRIPRSDWRSVSSIFRQVLDLSMSVRYPSRACTAVAHRRNEKVSTAISAGHHPQYVTLLGSSLAQPLDRGFRLPSCL